MPPDPRLQFPLSAASPVELAVRSSDFLSGSAHEFRNRLTGLSYAAEALESELVEGSANSALTFLQILRRSILQTHRHFNNLLLAQDLARQSIRPVLTRSLVDDLLSKTLSHQNISGSSHRIDVQFTPGLSMMADPSLLSVLLLHLIENALHFSPADSRIQLIVSATPQHILFEVLDRGPGIPFLLAAPSSQTPSPIPQPPLPKRRGLGLYIAQMISNVHKGTLSLSPRQDGGTIAQLLIPNT